MPSKINKDKNAPKRPLTAYLLFSADERPKLKASGLDNFVEMSKALGAAWKQVKPEVKAYYEKEHEKEKLRYEKELEQYQQSGEKSSSSKLIEKTHSKSKTPMTKATSIVTKPPIKKIPANSKQIKQDSDEDKSIEESESEEEKSVLPMKGLRKKIL